MGRWNGGKRMQSKAERNRAHSRKWRKEHPEECRARHAAYRKAHPEKINEACKRYRAAHPDRVKASCKAYRKTNAEKVRAASGAWNEANQSYKKAWRAEHPDLCKGYYRRYQLALYGLTQSDYSRLLAAQGGVCAICATDKPGGKRGEWSVDHCHNSLVVRGLLCSRCNTVLGFLRDDRSLLPAFDAYLAAAEKRAA
jgi:hypothetical protein